MKIIRFNEGKNNGPTINDYIICKLNDYLDITKFLHENIGRIREDLGVVKYDSKWYRDFIVSYENIPDDLLDFFHLEKISDEHRKLFNMDNDKKMVIKITSDYILACGKTIEELEMKLLANKFNL